MSKLDDDLVYVDGVATRPIDEEELKAWLSHIADQNYEAMKQLDRWAVESMARAPTFTVGGGD